MRETFQLFVYRRKYILSLEKWLEVLQIVATFISVSDEVDSKDIKTHFSAIAILLGWFEVLLLSGRLPLLSVQLEMLKTVNLTFLKFMAGYLPLLIALTFSFYIVFKGILVENGAKHIDNSRISLLHTIVMLAGEFKASSLYFDIFSGTSHVVFSCLFSW
jgi:hypothetical protein